MLIKIDDLQLYMGVTAEAADCYLAKNFLDSTGVAYSPYMYVDAAQHQANFDAIMSWKLQGAPEVIDKFPFLIYTEVHDDLPPSQYPRKMLYGAGAIVSSNIADLFALGR